MKKNLTLGQRIKRYRLLNDIRQEDMAEELNVSRATLINYEKGHTTINVDVLTLLNKVYPDFSSEKLGNEKPKILENNNINFGILFKVLGNNKKNIIISIIIFAIIGTGVSFFFTKYYNAQITLYPAKNDTVGGLGQFQSLATTFGMNVSENNQDFNIPDVVKSRLIANKTLKEKWINVKGEELELLDLWGLGKHNWYSSFKSNKVDSAYIREQSIKIFAKRLKVLENRATGLITIGTRFEDPKIASSIANFIGNQVQLYIQKENSAQSTKEKLFISDRLSILKRELETSEVELKIFKERNRGYEESPELFLKYSRFFREVESKKQIFLTLQQQLELARIEEVKKTSVLHILDYATVPPRKSSPNRILFLLISGLLGFVFSSTLIVFKY